MIQVIPDASVSPQKPALAESCWQPVSRILTPLTPPSLGCNPHGIGQFSDPATLATLKAQLQEALKAVEEQEKLLHEQTSIKTVAEAQALEDHLTDAIAEVRLQKEQLQNAGNQG